MTLSHLTFPTAIQHCYTLLNLVAATALPSPPGSETPSVVGAALFVEVND